MKTKTTIEKLHSVNRKILNKIISVDSTSGKRDLNYSDVRTYYDALVKNQKLNPSKIAVKVFGVDITTAKSFNDLELRDYDSEDYYEGKVADPDVYRQFYKIQFIIRN